MALTEEQRMELAKQTDVELKACLELMAKDKKQFKNQ